MASLPELNFTCITEEHFKEELDEDVIYATMHMDSPREALMKSHVLKEDGNKRFKSKDYRRALNREDYNTEKRRKHWRCNGPDKFDKDTHTKSLCGKRKDERSRLEDVTLINKKRVINGGWNRVGCNICMFPRTIVAGMNVG